MILETRLALHRGFVAHLIHDVRFNLERVHSNKLLNTDEERKPMEGGRRPCGGWWLSRLELFLFSQYSGWSQDRITAS